MAAAPARYAASRRRCLISTASRSSPSVPCRANSTNFAELCRCLFGLVYYVWKVLPFGPLAWLVLTLVGCRSSSELLEAELRRKERENEQLTQKLRDCECEVRLLEADYERILREIRTTGKADIRAPAYVKEITLGRLTGGLDDDPHCPGDDALVIMVEPRDLDDQVVKVPGHVHIDVYEIHPQGLKQPLSSWDVPARELRGKWETPLLGSPGYRLVLRWKVMPHYERLRVVVRFTTLDGRVFETDRDVTIRLPRRDPDRCRLPTHSSTCPTHPTPSYQPSLGTPLRRALPSATPPLPLETLLVPPSPPPASIPAP